MNKARVPHFRPGIPPRRRQTGAGVAAQADVGPQAPGSRRQPRHPRTDRVCRPVLPPRHVYRQRAYIAPPEQLRERRCLPVPFGPADVVRVLRCFTSPVPEVVQVLLRRSSPLDLPRGQKFEQQTHIRRVVPRRLAFHRPERVRKDEIQKVRVNHSIRPNEHRITRFETDPGNRLGQIPYPQYPLGGELPPPARIRYPHHLPRTQLLPPLMLEHAQASGKSRAGRAHRPTRRPRRIATAHRPTGRQRPSRAPRHPPRQPLETAQAAHHTAWCAPVPRPHGLNAAAGADDAADR